MRCLPAHILLALATSLLLLPAASFTPGVAVPAPRAAVSQEASGLRLLGQTRRRGVCIRMTEFAVGAEVCVKCSATFYHIPGHKEGRDAVGMVGKVVRVYTEAHLDSPLPVKVQFQEPKPWIAHFDFPELELASAPADAPDGGGSAAGGERSLAPPRSGRGSGGGGGGGGGGGASSSGLRPGG